MFAGAASYSDKADIKASTAVDMLSSLGVIQGYDDGSFKPNTTVTRAQMAKMIFTIMNGGNDNANAYASLPTAFTDLRPQLGHRATYVTCRTPASSLVSLLPSCSERYRNRSRGCKDGTGSCWLQCSEGWP